MLILAHRGYWKEVLEKNQRSAFERAFKGGFGSETDLRDNAGKIVIAHDMPKGNELSFEEVLQIMDGRNLPLALNIKADGQGEAIQELLEKYQHTNYFTFDMSIADLVCQIQRGLQVFTGLSDILPKPVMLESCAGVWLDSFYTDWFDADTIDNLLACGKKICIVSAELHQRARTKQWEIINKCQKLASQNLMLCTDVPEEAMRYFSDKN
ncbi:MAG: phosphodiesterase [Deltaproteobacteria bacterium]|jgi:hypothetical protein|nr:phosphodiesterase [Deltaproteobacteria bacterium]